MPVPEPADAGLEPPLRRQRRLIRRPTSAADQARLPRKLSRRISANRSRALDAADRIQNVHCLARFTSVDHRGNGDTDGSDQ